MILLDLAGYIELAGQNHPQKVPPESQEAFKWFKLHSHGHQSTVCARHLRCVGVEVQHSLHPPEQFEHLTHNTTHFRWTKSMSKQVRSTWMWWHGWGVITEVFTHIEHEVLTLCLAFVFGEKQASLLSEWQLKLLPWNGSKVFCCEAKHLEKTAKDANLGFRLPLGTFLLSVHCRSPPKHWWGNLTLKMGCKSRHHQLTVTVCAEPSTKSCKWNLHDIHEWVPLIRHEHV